eukprot:SAG25_NODE_881_length_4969_cov_53.695072_3_plen_79_part_00
MPGKPPLPPWYTALRTAFEPTCPHRPRARQYVAMATRAVRDSGCDAARTGLTLENKGISVLRPSMDGLTLVVALSLSF